MGYSQENGYVPVDIPTIMLSIMGYINIQFGTTYTVDTFPGTNLYKYFYALAQRMQENEVKTSEIFAKLQQYIDITNERISRPVTTAPGTVEKMQAEGYVASTKPPLEIDAGKRFICVDVNEGVVAKGTVTISSYANLVSGTDDAVGIDGTTFTAQAGAATPGTGTFQAATSNTATALSLATQINAHATASAKVYAVASGAIVYIFAKTGGTAGNAFTLTYTDNDTNVGASVSGATLTGGTNNADYAAEKLAICTLISQITAGGIVTQGDQTETIVLSNGQAFDWSFYLPNRIPVALRLTITTSENNQLVIGDPDDVKEALIDNIAARYRLGLNFEPQRYFSASQDAPWASQVLLEWTDDVIWNGSAYEVAASPTYSSSVYDADYRDLFVVDLARVTLVEV